MFKQIFILAAYFSITIITIAQPPKNAVRSYIRGQKLREQGMYYEAIQSFKKATALYRNYDSAYLEWSDLYLRMNKADDALLVLHNAAKQNPEMRSAYITMGGIYKDKKMNYDSAI